MPPSDLDVDVDVEFALPMSAISPCARNRLLLPSYSCRLCGTEKGPLGVYATKLAESMGWFSQLCRYSCRYASNR